MNLTNLALPRIVLCSSHADELQMYLEGHPHGHERAAIVFFRRLQRSVSGLPNSDRYLSVDIVPFEEEWLITKVSELKITINILINKEISALKRYNKG